MIAIQIIFNEISFTDTKILSLLINFVLTKHFFLLCFFASYTVITDSFLKENVVTMVEKSMLRWFGHVERMSERRLTKRIYDRQMTDVSGNAGRGCPKKIYPDLIGEVIQKGQLRSTYS